MTATRLSNLKSDMRCSPDRVLDSRLPERLLAFIGGAVNQQRCLMIGESRPGDNLRRKLIRDLLTSSLPANVIARSAVTKQSSSPPNRASHWIDRKSTRLNSRQ